MAATSRELVQQTLNFQNPARAPRELRGGEERVVDVEEDRLEPGHARDCARASAAESSAGCSIDGAPLPAPCAFRAGS